MEAQLADCYKDRYISDNFTNVQQISICKKEKHDEVFDKFYKSLAKHRESDVIRLTNCQVDAGGDIIRVNKCFTDYILQVRESNQSLKAAFA